MEPRSSADVAFLNFDDAVIFWQAGMLLAEN
jgi:hypothetical protein